nr:MAG TPA: putative tail fiber protein [Caudoviricetes sp.]
MADISSIKTPSGTTYTLKDSTARNHIGNKNNPHGVNKAQVGLGNVDNTRDADKPVSTAVQKALDNKANNSVATSSANGLMSKDDKTKLDELSTMLNIHVENGVLIFPGTGASVDDGVLTVGIWN